MNNDEVMFLAEQFLRSLKIGFVTPGEIGQVYGERVEVIFPVPEVFDPNVAIVDPPDVRVWVDKKTKKVELIRQM